MTTFKDVFGPKMGQMMEQYWPYAFLVFSTYLILFQIGIWKIIYKLAKQIIVMSIMLICCTIWYVLMSQHASVLMQLGTTAILSAFNDTISGNSSGLLSNSKIMDPLTEIFVVSGATLCILGLLYRQLPIDLIPDCIPCIGQYDNMMAGFCAFVGFVICLIGIYFQIYFTDSPNSTTSILNKSKNYMHSAGEFMQNNDEKKWDSVVPNAQYFIQRGSSILKESVSIIYNQINQQFENKNSNIPRNEL